MQKRGKMLGALGVVAVVIIAMVIVLFATHKKAGDPPTAKTNSSNMSAMDSSGANSGSPSTNNGSNADTHTIDNNANTGSPVAATAVAIQNFAFSPANITVKVGSTVTWTNKDSAAHTVTADTSADDAPASDTIAAGSTFSFTFNKAGTYQYHCAIHPSMKGTVTVTN